jgi:hypothetical protein
MIQIDDAGTARCALSEWLTHGPSVAGRVKRVEITDREPDCRTDDWRGWRNQDSAPGLSRRYIVPGPIWGAMVPAAAPHPEDIYRSYPTEAAAKAALSDACIAHAKARTP